MRSPHRGLQGGHRTVAGRSGGVAPRPGAVVETLNPCGHQNGDGNDATPKHERRRPVRRKGHLSSVANDSDRLSSGHSYGSGPASDGTRARITGAICAHSSDRGHNDNHGELGGEARTAARQGRALQRQGHSERGLRDCSEGARAGALEQAPGGLLWRAFLLLVWVSPVGRRHFSLDGSPVDVEHGSHDVEPSSESQEDRRRRDQVGIPSSPIEGPGGPEITRDSSIRMCRWMARTAQSGTSALEPEPA